MAFKIVLILTAIAQLTAAGLALRINFRYRIYSAWFFLSASASVGAILRLTTLSETWALSPTMQENWSLWLNVLASLLSSLLLLAGMSLIEPFFMRLAEAEQALRREHRQLTSIVKETEEELQLAQRIQRQLLPTSSPTLDGLDIHGESAAADWTSGDYFDYLALSNGDLAVVIADVSGHGLGPALLMASTRASFRGLASNITDVGELLTMANRAALDSVSGSDFVTAFAAQWDIASGKLFFAGAGHTAFYLSGGRDPLTLDADGPPLGIMPEMKITTQCCSSLKSGDILLLVTDGIIEARNAAGEMFGEPRLVETVAAHHQRSAQTIVTQLIAACRDFTEDEHQQDDITAVVVKFL